METKQITVPRIITNGYCVVRPQYIFLYGYDVQGKSMDGQARILGHLNTFSIPTMYKFCNSGARYFTDADNGCKFFVDYAIEKVPLDGRPIIPLRRMGQGCSRMNELAPITFAYLINKLKQISYPNIRWDYNDQYTNEY